MPQRGPHQASTRASPHKCRKWQRATTSRGVPIRSSARLQLAAAPSRKESCSWFPSIGRTSLPIGTSRASVPAWLRTCYQCVTTVCSVHGRKQTHTTPSLCTCIPPPISIAPTISIADLTDCPGYSKLTPKGQRKVDRVFAPFQEKRSLLGGKDTHAPEKGSRGDEAPMQAKAKSP